VHPHPIFTFGRACRDRQESRVAVLLADSALRGDCQRRLAFAGRRWPDDTFFLGFAVFSAAVEAFDGT
jgi:hypothetical protein